MQDQEIALMDYINIVMKRKLAVILIFLIATISTAVISIYIPKAYQISMIVEPTVLARSQVGKAQYLDSPRNIEARIKGGAFNAKIIKSLGLMSKNGEIDFKVSQPKDSNMVKISLVIAQGKTNTGLKILDLLYKELRNMYKENVEYYRNLIDQEIFSLSNQTVSLSKGIGSQQKKLVISDQRAESIMDELKEVKKNSVGLVTQREKLLSVKPKGDEISALLYSNVIQENISYFNSLNEQLSEIKVAKEDLAMNIQNLQKETNGINIKINKLKLKKGMIHNIKLVQEPEVSRYPMGTGRKQNVIVAGIISLILGVFFALFIDYIDREKKVKK